ncbi:helix-turn-helix domain-containing protein [Metallosphaera tengchongensis]|uniref:Helix-turn-helix domain-containing protein n=2 Tax=Metallosphaera tengchongensis TaxID=1532350 RepID=A0A6N0P0K1_9CREN|nr:helix-turn-helix domain-containing protein [Metallosphaera tengchongensis]
MGILGDKHTVIEKVDPQTDFTNHIIKVDLLDRETKRLLTIGGVRIVELKGGKQIWAKAPSCSSCKFLSKTEVMILNAKPLSQNEIVYKLLVPSVGYLKTVITELNSLGLKPRVLKTDKPREDDLELTDRQLQILLLTYKKGYYDVERKASLTEIAKELGISPSSAEELLRRALKKVVGKYLNGTF